MESRLQFATFLKIDKKMTVKVVTHDGSFHTDEIFATALIKKFVTDDIELIRTRDKEKLRQATRDPEVWVVDVGRKHDDSMRNFDHHQRSFVKCWEGTDVPFSSCGLVWRYLRERGLISQHYSEEVINGVEEALIKRVDMHDNRYQPMPQAIMFKLCNREDSSMEDFERALMIAEIHLEDSFIFSAKKSANLSKLGEVELMFDGEVAVYDEEVSTAITWVRRNTNAKIIVMPKKGVDTWSVKSVAGEEEGILTPFWWRGLEENDLRKVSGIHDISFAHKAGFLAVVGSKASALEVAKQMLFD